MRIHHLNCVSACPLGGYLMDGLEIAAIRGRLTSHCLLLETAAGLVLIDTGYGLRDVIDPRSRLSPFFLALNRPELREAMTAVRQIEALGFSARDVRHIVLSHLDFDHAGGLDDFPEATVHLLEDEVDAAAMRRTLLDRMRYRPQQWSTRPRWRTYSATGERWRGFACVQELEGVPPGIFLLPLRGHTLGHAGVVIETGERALLYAGDAYFYHAEMHARPRCTPGLRLYQTMMEKDRGLSLENQRRLRVLANRTDANVTVFCAHDVRELERLSGRSHRIPIGLAAPAAMATPAGAPPLAGRRAEVRS